MPDQWVVLLEAAGDTAHGAIDVDDLKRLHRALDPGRYGGALHCPDRYVLQVTATGPGPVAALLDVVARWADAVGDLGLPAWKLVRTEVFTPEDLEREFDRARGEEIDVESPEADSGPEDPDDIGHELLRRAFSDPLTGLLGSEACAHRLEAAMAPSRGRRPVAMVCLDLDGFQGVNHLLGGARGDEVLIALARRLAAMLRPTDVLARLGGDEYGVLLEDSTEDAALAVAQRMLDAVRLPMTVSGQELTLSASAGVALSHPGDDAQAVLDNAGAALGAAKAGGGGGPVLYGSDVSHSAQRRQYFATPALQDRLAHLLLMQQAAVAANEANTLHQAAQVVMHHICSQVGCAVGHLWVSPAVSGEVPQTPLWHTADGGHHPGSQTAAEKLLATSGRGLAGRAEASGRPVWIADLPDDDDLRHQQAAAAGLQSAFAFPVVVGPEVVAVLAFFSRTPMEPTDSFLDVLAAMGAQLGRVVERQRAAEALRRSAEQLRASEARLREAEALTRLGSWHFDLRTGKGSWSEGTGALYGIDPHQPLDLASALAAIHPGDRSRAQAVLSGLVERGGLFAEDIRIVRRDGQVRWHHAPGSVIRDDDGVVVAIQGTSQDITEAKLAQEVLRERERQLAEAQRAAGLGWWERDLSSGRITWSDEMCRLFGWDPRDEITFDAFLAMVEPEDAQRILHEGARLRRTGEPFLMDFRATPPDGRQRWFRGGAHMLYDEEGKAVKLFGTAQDVTEQKQTEHELRSAKDLYQRIVQTTHEGIVTVDAQNVITFVNPGMAQILGYSIEEMTGMPASAFVDEETHALLAGHQRRRRQGMSDHYEAQLRAKDGAVVQVLVSASPFMDEKGEYAGALAMVTDVTAVREAEDILRSQSLRIQAEVDEYDGGEKPPAC